MPIWLYVSVTGVLVYLYSLPMVPAGKMMKGLIRILHCVA